jgi:DNA polymerase-3 subunit delta'
MFRLSLEAGRLPHALLFVGLEGIGKKAFALKLAQTLLCERRPEAALDPCEQCTACVQVKGGTHPDLLQVARPEEKHDLPIKVIRDLCIDLGMKPARGARKVAIIDDADDLNDEAANAFLKTLEEPPPGTTLILIGTSAEVQLDTIVSRCRVVRFDPLPEDELAEVLREQGVSTDPDEIARLAKLGEGSPGRARGLASPDLAGFRRAMLEDVSNPHGFDPSALARRIEEFSKAAGKESIDQRNRASLLIGELARFFRGVLWQTAGLEPPSADPADLDAVRTLAPLLEPEDVFLLADRCLTADYHVGRKANLGLLLDSLTHDLAAIIQPPGGRGR